MIGGWPVALIAHPGLPMSVPGPTTVLMSRNATSRPPQTTDIIRPARLVRFVPKGDMLAKARTQLQGEAVLRLGEDKAAGSIRATHGRHNDRSLVPCARGPSAVNLCGPARDKQP